MAGRASFVCRYQWKRQASCDGLGASVWGGLTASQNNFTNHFNNARAVQKVPPHVIPAPAGLHSDAANPGPARGGLVGRRDRHGDDVGGVSGRAGFSDMERAALDDWTPAPTPMCLAGLDPASTWRVLRCAIVQLACASIPWTPDQVRRGTWGEARCDMASVRPAIPGARPSPRHVIPAQAGRWSHV